MRFLNSVFKVGLDGQPFAPSLKCNPALAAPLITAGGSAIASLLGGIFGSSSQSSANAANLEVARMNQQSVRETNQLNRELNASNQAWQEKMWKLQNEYNLPKNQVQRLLAAGINPSAGFGQTTPAGAVGVPQSIPNQPETLDYHQQAYDPSGAFQGAVNAFTQSRLATAAIKKSEEETHGITLDNEEKLKGMQSRLEYLSKMAKHEGYVGELAKTQLEFELKAFNIRQAMLGADYTMQLKQINKAQREIEAADLQNQLYKIQVAYAPKMNDAQLKQYYMTVNQLKAQIGLINSNRMLTDEQRLHEIEKKTGTIIDNGMKGLDLKLKDETKKYVIQNARNEAEMTDFERRNQVWSERVRRLSSFVPFVNGYSKLR